MSLGINTRITDTREQATPFSRGKTLYVGGDGPGNYTKIQDAIDDANHGDTVFVYDDSSPYWGVVINKMINLIGENRDTTVIEAIVKITADNVNISGFTIQWVQGVGIYIYSNYNTITGNNILYNSWGIGIIENSSSNTITGNNISNNGFYDILLWSSSNNTIINNNIMNRYHVGISLGFSSNNTIMDNNITSKDWHGIHLYDSSNNTITGNNVSSNNGYGIGLAGFSNNNIITGNTITWNNRNGIKLVGFSNYNIIYHNNFINNTNNAYDECNNIWDNGKSGNYWDDYTGEDNDSDGIGDTPYSIPGGDNEDRYPLMEPWDGENHPPQPPIINGTTNGKLGIDYNYTFVSTDPEGDYVWYHICWGDKEIIYIYGPYPSGEEITLSYNWSEKGTYIISCWARDIYDAESNITTLEVTMPRNRATYNSLFLRFLEQFPILQRLLSLIRV